MQAKNVNYDSLVVLQSDLRKELNDVNKRIDRVQRRALRRGHRSRTRKPAPRQHRSALRAAAAHMIPKEEVDQIAATGAALSARSLRRRRPWASGVMDSVLFRAELPGYSHAAGTSLWGEGRPDQPEVKPRAQDKSLIQVMSPIKNAGHHCSGAPSWQLNYQQPATDLSEYIDACIPMPSFVRTGPALKTGGERGSNFADIKGKWSAGV